MIFKSFMRLAFWLVVALAATLLVQEAARGQEKAETDTTPPCSSPGFILASGPLDAADHELDDGAATINGYTLFVNRMSPPVSWMFVREHRGRVVELVLRSITPHQPQKLIRQ